MKPASEPTATASTSGRAAFDGLSALSEAVAIASANGETPSAFTPSFSKPSSSPSSSPSLPSSSITTTATILPRESSFDAKLPRSVSKTEPKSFCSDSFSSSMSPSSALIPAPAVVVKAEPVTSLSRSVSMTSTPSPAYSSVAWPSPYPAPGHVVLPSAMPSPYPMHHYSSPVYVSSVNPAWGMPSYSYYVPNANYVTPTFPYAANPAYNVMPEVGVPQGSPTAQSGLSLQQVLNRPSYGNINNVVIHTTSSSTVKDSTSHSSPVASSSAFSSLNKPGAANNGLPRRIEIREVYTINSAGQYVPTKRSRVAQYRISVDVAKLRSYRSCVLRTEMSKKDFSNKGFCDEYCIGVFKLRDRTACAKLKCMWTWNTARFRLPRSLSSCLTKSDAESVQVFAVPTGFEDDNPSFVLFDKEPSTWRQAIQMNQTVVHSTFERRDRSRARRAQVAI